MGGDTRFDDMRSKFWSFAQFWIAQMLWVWVVSLPVILLNSPAISYPGGGGYRPEFGTGTDIAGIILWAIGLFWESAADLQKVRAIRGPAETICVISFLEQHFDLCIRLRDLPKFFLSKRRVVS